MEIFKEEQTHMDKAEQVQRARELLENLQNMARTIQKDIADKRHAQQLSDEFSMEVNRKLLRELEYTLKEGPWQQGILFQNIAKKLQALYDKYKDEFREKHGEEDIPKTTPHLANRVAQRSGFREIFVSLYNSQGHSIEIWEKILRGLSGQFVARPIYQSEDDIRALIRSKSHKNNEAYAVAYIDEKNILKVPPDKIPHDKLNHELLMIKDKAIELDNITRFMHVSGRYYFKEHKLQREGDVGIPDFI
jgi:intracellular multiplication protein IcmQ